MHHSTICSSRHGRDSACCYLGNKHDIKVKQVTKATRRSHFDVRTVHLEQFIIETKKHKIYKYKYTGCLQMSGAVSKVNKKFISHLTRAKRTPLAAATVPVSYVLIAVLQCVHPGSHDTHPHGNQIHPRLGVACPL